MRLPGATLPALLLGLRGSWPALVAVIWQLSPTTQTRFAELADNLRNATTGENYATSGGVRWRMYQEAFQGMVEHPLLGTGVGS